MKQAFIFTGLLALASGAHADTLNTPSFTIEIKVNCPEGDVTCDNVSYFGKSKKSGKSISLHGRTMHSLCADGKTPCRFLGYEFKRGDTRYLVQESGELLVTQGKKVLVQEQGEWQY
jgi:hypothetical protein